ncbi:MAG: SDR family NAD(P)-dependent oxidoreductase [Acidimicrobiia bacterium]
MQLNGRTILVTGGSSGIGRALSRAYAQEGAQVWSVGRRPEALAETAGRAHPGHIEPVVADLTEPEGRSSVAAAVSGDVDALDVAVHAAGLLGPPGVPLELYPSSDWYEVLEANLSVIHFLHVEIAPLHHRADRPTVIGVSSSVGRQARAGWGMYAISKYALEGWLALLADEWSDRGRVYSVNPGGTRTPMRAAAMPEEDPDTLPGPSDITPIFLRLAHAACEEPSGAQFEARDWIGHDPWPQTPQ